MRTARLFILFVVYFCSVIGSFSSGIKDCDAEKLSDFKKDGLNSITTFPNVPNEKRDIIALLSRANGIGQVLI